jgi:hypothetical protein
MHDNDLAALIIAALDERQLSGGDVMLAMLTAIDRLNLTGDVTPEVRRFAALVCWLLKLPAVVEPPPRRWNRRNGRYVTAVAELPAPPIVIE